ncbi:MAG: helix-turn-helix domain-containing protein [Steroidobacteraceae bacterium]
MDPIPVIAPVTDRPMTQDEKQFFRQLGGRIASLRKEQGFTQAQLAGVLGLTQQMVASYEVGRRRVPVSLLPKVATALAVSVETLIGQGRATPAKRGPAPKLQQQMERIQRLPRAKQRLVLQMLDGVLAQASR